MIMTVLETLVDFVKYSIPIEVITVLVFSLFLLFFSDVLSYFYTQKRVIKEDMDVTDVDAGKWMGKAENLIILTLMLLEAYTALGLVFAAKGIIRWESIKKDPVYICLGTIANFSCSIVIGGVLLWILKNEYFVTGIYIGLAGLYLSIIITAVVKSRK